MSKKLESSLKNMSLSLLLICAFMAAALGYVYSLTKGPIENAEKQKVNDAIHAVVPEFDNDPGSEVKTVNSMEVYTAKKNNQVVGYAVKSFSKKGFAGLIIIMVGFKPDGTIYNTSVMSQKETPGLGTKMKEPKFLDQFKNKMPGTFKISVKKDGGDVDAITAATISSRAFCDAILNAQETFKQYSNTQSDSTSINQGGTHE